MLHSGNFPHVVGSPIGSVFPTRESGSYERAATAYRGPTPERDTVPPPRVEARLPVEGHRDEVLNEVEDRDLYLARFGIEVRTPMSQVRVIVHATLRGSTARLDFELHARAARDDRNRLLDAASFALRRAEREEGPLRVT
jgi:hypothetical protein